MKSIFFNLRVVIAIFFVLLALFAIHPSFQEGAAIRFVDKGSAADFAKIVSPSKNSNPLDHEVITSIDGKKITNADEYRAAVSGIEPNRSISVATNKARYVIKTLPKTEIEYTGAVINQSTAEFYNETINGTIVSLNRTVITLVNETVEKVIGAEELGLTVYDAPKNNLRKGLDLEGGVRVMLSPEGNTSDEMMGNVVDTLDRRLNALGLNDVIIRKSGDLLGNKFVIVEIAGIQTKEIESRLKEQGKFEAKINDTVVFTGGGDVAYVCRTADCSGIDPRAGCTKTDSGYSCKFFFTVDLSPEAAERQASATKNLAVISEEGEQFLSQKIDFYLDDKLVDSLNIGAGLKGKAETKIQISGGGSGETRNSAVENTLSNMRNLQAVLQTGSLPIKLNVIKVDNLSPTLGSEFLKSSIESGVTALIMVSLIIFIRYRRVKLALPTIITNFAEYFIILGASAFMKTNFDLSAIAGIIIVIGTGVNDQIVMLDEAVGRKHSVDSGAGGRIKNAFMIVLMAFTTNFVAMLPLLWAGAGMLRGFAVTTMVGALVGILITRPAYAQVLGHIMKKEELNE
jgi:preprotein translocase subunit SecD